MKISPLPAAFIICISFTISAQAQNPINPSSFEALSSGTVITADQLTDANIASIIIAANEAEVKNGELAQERSENSDVKAFGKSMVKEHASINQATKVLTDKIRAKPLDNGLSKNLKSDADKAYSMLKTKRSEDFDRAYLQNEVSYHESVLNLIDTTLLLNVQNAELKSLLDAARPLFDSYLNQAKRILTQLK